MITRYATLFAMLCLSITLHAESAVESVNHSSDFTSSTVSENGMPPDIVERHSRWNFGPGALQTFKGWQYAAYWDDARRVSVARRKLPDGSWAVASLPGYKRTSSGDRGKGGVISRGFGDGHEKVSMGISPDGYVHLSFDHHLSTLRYRRSMEAIARDPDKVTWDGSLFDDVQNHLGLSRGRNLGKNGQGRDLQMAPKLESVTYPSFINHGNSMLLYLRMGGGSGAANSHLFRYSRGAWLPQDEPSSQFIDQRWSGGDGTVNAYPFGMVCQGPRCHLTWCWRDTPNHRTSHDLCYAYSDDGGTSWRNNEGRLIANRGRQFITAQSPGVTVVDIPQGTGYRNGGTMVVDDEGRVHVLARGVRGAPTLYQREPESCDWKLQKAPQLGKLLFFDGFLYLLSDDTLYRGSPSNPNSFSPITSGFEKELEDSKLCLDITRPIEDGWASIIGQKGKKVTVIDFRLK